MTHSMQLLALLEDFKTASPDEIRAHMSTHFGVQTRHELSHNGDDLFQLKYSQIARDFTKPVTHECRGVILRRDSQGNWEVAARPFDKFFNLDQGYCPIFQKAEFEAEISDCLLVEKADGTCIQVWEDKGTWRASTLGTITPQALQGGTKTFDAMFWEISGIDTNLLNPSCTYIFELCGLDNQVVTQYEQDHVVLLGIRDRETGSSYPIKPHLLSDKVRLPFSYSAKGENIKTQDDLWAFVESHSSDPKYGKNPEGFVVYWHGRPVAKCKNQRYQFLHRYSPVGGGSKGQIIGALMTGCLDDLYHDLTDTSRAYADKLQAYITESMKQWKFEMGSLAGEYPDRKTYAMKVMDTVQDARVRPFCFQHMDTLQKGGDFDGLLDSWLANSYEKFEGDWKVL